jgi:molecular chaperone GrpE
MAYILLLKPFRFIFDIFYDFRKREETMTKIKVESESRREEEDADRGIGPEFNGVEEPDSSEAVSGEGSGGSGSDGGFRGDDLVMSLRKEVDDLKERNLRVQAEFENYRKRTYKEITLARQQARIGSALPILNLFDTFGMAVVASKQSENADSIRAGLEMIQAGFSKTLDELGIERFEASGKFDPNRHEAVSTEFSKTVPEGEIIRQWKPGYRMGETLIRPATVIVSGGPEGDSGESNTERGQ